MEITPQELRGVEITEAFRGYNREAVNDLLERAASAVEAANERVRELSERLKATQLEADRGRETEEILHRTLLLAQRAADEAVADAQQKSRAMLEDAELESHKLVADAQSEAQRRGDAERIRIEDEIIDLASRRDALLADVDALTRFEGDFRTRVTATLEADLERVRNRETDAPGRMPEPQTIEIPAFAERVERTNRAHAADAPDEASESPPGAALAGESAAVAGGAAVNGSETSHAEPLAGPDAGQDAGQDDALAAAPDEVDRATKHDDQLVEQHVDQQVDQHVDTTPRVDGEKEAAAASAPEPDGVPASGPSGNGFETLHPEALSSTVLDDDAFFASLREAVTDETPLGPRDDQRDDAAFFEGDEERSSLRDVFRRRR